MQSNRLTLAKLQRDYRALIDDPRAREEDIHQFLVQFPCFLPLWFPFDNVVFSKLPLGNQFVSDFAFGRENTPGFTWHLIEIEKPQFRLFTKSGNPSAQLTHAIRQIHEWAGWFADNRSYIEKYFPHSANMKKSGLWTPECKIVLGRRSEVSDRDKRLLQQMHTNRIEIMTFDRLVENVAFPACDRTKPLRTESFRNGIGTPLPVTRIAVRIQWEVLPPKKQRSEK